MNTKIREHLLVLLLVATLFGCSGGPSIAPGQVEALQTGYTALSIQRAAQGMLPSASVLFYPPTNTYFVAWPSGNVWGAACINAQCPGWMTLQGFAATARDVSAIVKVALASGWVKVAAVQLRDGVDIRDLMYFPITPTTIEMVEPQS
jgi:hypothetical protein